MLERKIASAAIDPQATTALVISHAPCQIVRAVLQIYKQRECRRHMPRTAQRGAHTSKWQQQLARHGYPLPATTGARTASPNPMIEQASRLSQQKQQGHHVWSQTEYFGTCGEQNIAHAKFIPFPSW